MTSRWAGDKSLHSRSSCRAIFPFPRRSRIYARVHHAPCVRHIRTARGSDMPPQCHSSYRAAVLSRIYPATVAHQQHSHIPSLNSFQNVPLEPRLRSSSPSSTIYGAPPCGVSQRDVHYHTVPPPPDVSSFPCHHASYHNQRLIVSRTFRNGPARCQSKFNA